MTQADAVKILYNMCIAFPWINKCVKICTVADVPTTYDFSDIFDKDADVSARDLQKTE
jgi:virulence-associated protein VapD